ncbi:unnamed protein product [Mytilus coruscus]|uniref:Uncharacterized protein n=1 Tax=Mytilus coruscus TaxID=42192 RepID=A0A6J8AQC0_MYTCO|nr:unnamed protein product [Mytilus coruscus]
MDKQRMKEEEKQRQIEEEKKKAFRIPKKPRPSEEITEQTDKSAKLSAQEKLEKAKKLAASFGKAKTVVSSSKSDSNKSSLVSDKSSSKHKHDKPSHSEQRKTENDKHSNDKDVSRQTVKKPSNDKHSNDKDVPKQSDKKPSYKDKLEKMSDQEKLAIIKKISGSPGRVGDTISDTEKLDKNRKISETIGKGSSSNSGKNEKPNGYPKYSPLSSKIDRDKMKRNVESLQKIKKEFKEAEERVNRKTITMLGKTDEGIKREVIFDRTDAKTMRYALQEKAARKRAMMNRPEEPKPRERKMGKDRASETEAKGKKSETSKNEDDEQRKYSDFKKSSSHSSDTKYNDKYSDDKSSDRSAREAKPVKKKKPPPPPSMNFNHVNDLFKIAEQKSQEPVTIEVIKKPKKGEERLLTKREMASHREYQEYLKNKKIRRGAEIEERQTVDVKREKQIPNSLKSKSTSNLVTKSASSSQNTVRKNPYSEKLVTKSSSPVPSSSKLSSSNKLGKSMSSSSIPSKPFTKQFKLHSLTHSEHNSDSNPAKTTKREHIENERISQKDEHRKKSNVAKKRNSEDVRENLLVCGPPKNEKQVPSNPPERIYGEIKKNQPTKPDQIRQAVIVRTDNMATSNKRGAKDTRRTIKGTKRFKGTNDFDHHSKDVQPNLQTSEIVLRIIAKTDFKKGYCYLGFDEENGRIFRPIMNTRVCAWPVTRDFCWKNCYRFEVTLNPQENKVNFATPHPHRNEDLVVTSIVKEEKTEPFNVQILVNVAKPDIQDIFVDIQEKQYLFNNAHSPSAGILKCRSRNVSLFWDDHSKKSRFRINLSSGHYVFRMKGINIDDIPKVDREILVVLGLGRPFTQERSFHPARCYIIVVGLFVV